MNMAAMWGMLDAMPVEQARAYPLPDDTDV